MKSRRQFLKSAALASGSLSPFANSLAANIRAGEEGLKPLRFVFFLQGNGIYPDQIQPEGIDRPKKPGDLEDLSLEGHPLPKSIAPLEPFKDRLTLLHGLSGRVAGPPSHSADFGALGCYPQRHHAFGETIDAALAKAHPGIFPHVGLGVSGRANDSVIYNVSAWEKGKALPTQCQPLLAYQRLFAGSSTGDARKAFDAKTNVLEFLADDVRRVQGQLNHTEKEKLDFYLNAFESMGERQAKLIKAGERISKSGRALDPTKFPSGAGGFEHLEAQFSIAAGSLIAGMTNVVTISSGSGLGFSGIEVDGEDLGFAPGPVGLHGIGHGGSFCGQSSEALHIAIRERHTRALATFMKQLEAIPEGNGTMLDNTLVIFLSDHGDSHHPQCFEWPFLVLGDLGGRLKPGNRYLRYPWYREAGHRTTANFYNTLLHIAGVPRQRFGLADFSLKDIDQDSPLDELLA